MDAKRKKEVDAFVARKLAALNRKTGARAEKAMTRVVMINKEAN
ncbi:hypothetical protein [Faecalibaculum rodentium]|nr:hypothetical protein [Faecalibaculum rodentium]